MRRTLVSLAVLALVAAPTSALAGGGCNSDFDPATHLFETTDADGSGTISPEEFADAGLERYGLGFDAYDTDGDGEASLDEYLELFDRTHPVEDQIES